jgi:F-type H+-transporting ATPase subunit delta
MAVISNNDIARAVYLATKDKSTAEMADVSKKVVTFLSKRRLLGKSKNILVELGKMVNKEEGRIVAKVYSAIPLDLKMRAYLEQAIKKRYSATHVVLNERVDSGLVGGVRIEVNDELIDLSIKNRIYKLQEYLTKSV